MLSLPEATDDAVDRNVFVLRLRDPQRGPAIAHYLNGQTGYGLRQVLLTGDFIPGCARTTSRGSRCHAKPWSTPGPLNLPAVRHAAGAGTVGLSCELSPLVFAELYRMLAGDRQLRAELLDDRLGEIGCDVSWLEERQPAYEKTWQGNLRVATCVDDLITLGPDHSLLASWVLAPLRASGSGYEFGDDLHGAVTRRALTEITGRSRGVAEPLEACRRRMDPGHGRWCGRPDLPVAPAMLPAIPTCARRTTASWSTSSILRRPPPPGRR